MLENSSKFKKTLLSSAAIALIGAAGVMGAPKDVNAAALAYSALTVTGLTANIFDPNANGGTGGSFGIGNIGGFTNFQFTLSGLFVNLTGNTPQFSPGTVIGNTTVAGTVLPQTQLCLVDCTGFTDDVYVSGTAPGPATAIAPLGANYAVADNNMNNTLLDGSGTFGVQAAASSLGGGTIGSGDTLVGSTMNWNFATDVGDGGKIFSLDWVEDRLTQIQTTLAGESAQIQLDFRITLENLTLGGGEVELFSLNSDLFTSGAADPTVAPQENENDIGFAVSSASLALAADSEYELVFTFGSSAQASSPAVPEPGTIGLLGIGLLGLGAVRYRRRRKQAA